MTAQIPIAEPQKQVHKRRPRFNLGKFHFAPGAMETKDRLHAG
jgi:hypothetical protein